MKKVLWLLATALAALALAGVAEAKPIHEQMRCEPIVLDGHEGTSCLQTVRIKPKRTVRLDAALSSSDGQLIVDLLLPRWEVMLLRHRPEKPCTTRVTRRKVRIRANRCESRVTIRNRRKKPIVVKAFVFWLS